MGRLAKVTLSNFKSYRGTVVADLGQHYFTAIIGPNGAGKSNLMDAISFVLGMPLSELRSDDWDDLVYRGAGFEAHSLPNSTDTYVEAVYENDAGEVKVFRRTILVGRNKTRYSMQGRDVSSEAYFGELAQHNILVHARNFLVFQGDIDSIASKSPLELAAMLEQVSGSAGLKHEYDRLRKRLDKAKSATSSSFQDRRSAQQELRQFGEQRDVRDEYMTTRDELHELSLKRVAMRLKHVGAKQTAHATSLVELRDRHTVLSEESDGLKTASDRAQVLLAKEKKKSLGLRAEEATVEEELRKVRMELIPIDRKIEIARNEVKLLEPKIGFTREEVAKFAEDLKAVQRSIEIAERSRRELQDSSNDAVSKLNSLPQQVLTHYHELQEKYTMETAAVQSELDAMKRNKRLLQAQLASLRGRRDEVQARANALTERKQLSELKIAEQRASVAEYERQHIAKKAELIGINDRLHILSDSKDDVSKKLTEGTALLKTLDSGKRDAQRRNKFLDNVAKLKRLHPGVVDVMSNLVTPKEERFQRALDKVLASYFDAVVVDTFATAKACVEQLRIDSMGQMTFLPLDNLRVEPIDTSLRALHRGARLAIDTLEYSDRIRVAVAFVCGDTLICDDREIARSLRWERNVKSKIVSLDGSVIHRNNLMSFENSGNSSRYDERRTANLQRQLKAYVEKVKSLNEEYSDLQDQEVVVSAAYDKIKQDLAYYQELIAAETQQSDSLARELTHVESDLEPIAYQVEEHESRLSAHHAEQAKYVKEMQTARNEMFADFCAETGTSLDTFEYAMAQTLDAQSEYSKQMSRLNEQLSFAQNRYDDANNRLVSIETKKTALRNLARGLVDQRQSLNEQQSVLLAEQDDLASKSSESKERLESKLLALQDAERLSTDAAEQVEALDRQVRDLEEQISGTDEERETLLRQARVDGLVLSDSEIQDLEGRARDLPESTADLAADIASLDTDIKRLEDKLDQLNVNNRVDSYVEQAETRVQTLDEEVRDHRSTVSQLTREFEDIKRRRLEQFNEAFESVRSSIDSIYKELTTNDTHPLGGSANLIAINEEEPYLEGVTFSVMPPMKRFTGIEQLSGGEKSIAALALLFAIHRFRPSPFFVLDEIDAALDHANVGMVTNYIREHAGPNYQFIVISLKIRMFEQSDSLVGVHRQVDVEGSRLLMIDLKT